MLELNRVRLVIRLWDLLCSPYKIIFLDYCLERLCLSPGVFIKLHDLKILYQKPNINKKLIFIGCCHWATSLITCFRSTVNHQFWSLFYGLICLRFLYLTSFFFSHLTWPCSPLLNFRPKQLFCFQCGFEAIKRVNYFWLFKCICFFTSKKVYFQIFINIDLEHICWIPHM